MKTKKLVCYNCGGHGFITATYENGQTSAICPVCGGIGTHEIQMTNADRIRAMTDEELVELHYSSSAHCIADDPTVCDRHDFIGNLTPCEQCYLKWPQQTTEEADHVV